MAQLTDEELAGVRALLAAVPPERIASIPAVLSAGNRSLQLQDVGTAVLKLKDIISRADAQINNLIHAKDVLSSGTDTTLQTLLEMIQVVVGDEYIVSATGKD